MLVAACTRSASTPLPPTSIIPAFANLAVTITLPTREKPTATVSPVAASTNPGPRLCQTKDLTTSASSNADGDSILLGLTLFNSGSAPCVLTGTPQILLLTSQSLPIQVQYQLASSPEQTSPPASQDYTIQPGNVIIVAATWTNYCGAQLNKSLTVRFQLKDGTHLDTPVDLASPPTCKSKSQLSILAINPYTFPP